MIRIGWVWMAFQFFGVAMAEPGIPYEEFITQVSECKTYVVQAPSGSYAKFEVTKCLVPNWFQDFVGASSHHLTDPEYFRDQSECERERLNWVAQIVVPDPCPPEEEIR